MAQAALRSGVEYRSNSTAWRGHHPATRAAMEAILMRAIGGRHSPSMPERVLCSICEFRATIANNGLVKYLETGTLRELGDARFALNEIGAMDVAALLSDTLSSLRRTSSLSRETTLLANLERALLAAGQRLDELIAQYASRVRRQLARATRPQIID